MTISKSQIDKLGERLLRDPISRDDYELLDRYRDSFRVAFDTTVSVVLRTTGLAVSGRAAKSTTAIIGKLRRGSTKLSQMQDIAGCRVVVPSVSVQDSSTAAIVAGFTKAKIIDRRARPSHGYRAVHVVAWVGGQPVEVQIRTEMQHQWAQLSERLADLVGSDLKYGGGPPELRQALGQLSTISAELERRDAGRSPGDLTAPQSAQAVRQWRSLLNSLLQFQNLKVEQTKD